MGIEAKAVRVSRLVNLWTLAQVGVKLRPAAALCVNSSLQCLNIGGPDA